jgi:hypothetical protein
MIDPSSPVDLAAECKRLVLAIDSRPGAWVEARRADLFVAIDRLAALAVPNSGSGHLAVASNAGTTTPQTLAASQAEKGVK